MDRREYTEAVLSALRRVTGRERAAIRAEIDGHIEDHMEGLLELGYDPALAEERALAAMGDPKEVGRELDRQYPLGWLIVGRAAMALTIAVVLALGGGFCGFLSNTADNLRARFCPEKLAAVEELRDSLQAVEELDLRVKLDDVTVRVYQVGLEHADGGGMAYVALSCWNEDSFTEPPELLSSYAGGGGLDLKGSTCGLPENSRDGGKWVVVSEVPVNYGDTMEISYDRFGQTFHLSVPLPWKEGTA